MAIFAKTHFSQKNARLFSFLINLAIYFRAFLALIKRFADQALLPIFDAIIIYAGMFFIKYYWAQSVIFPDGGDYPPVYTYLIVPLYIIIWLTSVYLSGGYDKPINLFRIFRGLFSGTVFILVVYSLLDESLRFSRALTLLGALWGYISMTGTRLSLNLLGFKDFEFGENKNKRYLVIGDQVEADRVAGLLTTIELQPAFIGLVSHTDEHENKQGFIGTFDQVMDIINIYKINEIIFCAKNIPARLIIDKMSELQNPHIDFKIAPPESLSLIGSNSINTAGDLYTLELNPINKVINRRNKRSLDFISSFICMISLPLTVFVVKNPLGYIRNIFQVMFAGKTWVGYCLTKSHDSEKLPELKPGVLNPAVALSSRHLTEHTLERLNLLYARDYKIKNDLNIMFKGFRYMGEN
jgi:hypothetical protein